MMFKKLTILTAFAFAFFAFANIDTFAQGRGGGRPANPGRPAGNPSGGGVDRGLGNAGTRSAGRSDDGLGNASRRSNGRSDSGIERARAGRNMPTETELRRYTGLSRRLGTTPSDIQARYEAALATNPDLKFGQFVSAHVVADNLNSRFPNVTADALLMGLANGDSLGKTLKVLRVNETDSKMARTAAERAIKARNKD